MPITRAQRSPTEHPVEHPVEQRERFSHVLRERSRRVHQQAEGSGFVSALMDGRIDRAGYAAMVTQHLFIYTALESVAATLRDDPVAGPFISDRLERVPSIQADLAHLLGARWADTSFPLPSTSRYVERIHETAAWPAGFVAHHYTRYLGDLSGGLAIGSVVARVYGFAPGGDGVRFYRFERVPKPKIFKDRYRALLDAASWSSDERDRVIDEVLTAYRLNTDVFAELGDVHGPIA